MPLKVFGSPTSSCTQRVLITLRELGLDYELSAITLQKGEHKNPEYIDNYHPFGRIPVLQDGDFQLFESRAICKYLVSKYGVGSTLDTFRTNAAAELGAFEQHLSVDYSYFDPAVKTLGDEKLWKGAPADEANVKKASAALATCLDYFESRLQKNTFLAGKELTLVDIFILTWIPYFRYLGIEDQISSRPNFEALWKRVSARPAWKKILDDAAQ